MEIILKKIKKETFDDLMNEVVSRYEQTGQLVIDENSVEDVSEAVFVNGNMVKLSFNLDEYQKIADMDTYSYVKNAKIGMMLHRDMKDESGNHLPTNLLYEKEVWAYLSLTIFKDIVRKMRLEDDEKMNVDKIQRFYFSVRTLSRTCLLFVWSMVDRLDAENDEEMALTAFEFIDAVKAIYERTMSRNPQILKAYVQGIVRNGKDRRFKDKKLRTKVPSHISCYAGISILDAFEYNKLVDIITEQQKLILNT